MVKAKTSKKKARIGHVYQGARAPVVTGERSDVPRGWIHPSGKFFSTTHHWDAISDHLGDKGPRDPETGERNAHIAYSRGWISIGHGGVLAALLYLTLGTGLRPVPRSLPRVLAASLGYMAVAALADWALGTNYGFLRAKPLNVSLMSVLPPWPLYIPDLVLIGLASLLLYYAPFWIGDALRSYRTQSRRRPSASL